MSTSIEARPIKVVLYTPMYDTGGQGWKLKAAFDRHFPEEFSVRSIVTHPATFAYPEDMRYKPDEAYQLFAEADVIHMRNGVEGLKRLLKLRRELGKPDPVIVVHHHGTRFREWHADLAAQAREVGAIQIASTLDLCELEPDVEWLPAPFDVGSLASYRPTERPAGPVRIAHAPTNREVKGTERILKAVMALKKAGYSIVFDLIERQPWEECMRRKGLADIVIDQLELGIGNNALEAFGMAIPVIAGISDLRVRDAMVAKWGFLPFYEANHENLEERLAHLVRNDGLRAQYGGDGFDYLISWHQEQRVARQLAFIYRRAMEAA